MGPPGHWTEKFSFAGAPAASYNIILEGTDAATNVPYAVEYDCLIGVLGEVRGRVRLCFAWLLVRMHRWKCG
jgi:hypothetical protein